MLAAPHPSLPVLEGIVYAPCYTESGLLLERPGYDSRARVLLAGTARQPGARISVHDAVRLILSEARRIRQSLDRPA